MQNDLGELLVEAACTGNHKDAMQLILEGAPVDYENEHGLTPLLGATLQNHLACVRILLEANAPVETDHNGNTALFHAARNGLYTTLKYLITAKPLLISKPNKYGRTALMGAATDGDLDCVRALIAAGAQINYTNYAGESALSWAVRHHNLECVQELITAGARINQATIIGIPHNLNEYESNWPRYQLICELLVEAMLWIPNQDQKKSMCAFLACAKKYGKKYGFATGFISAWRAPLLAATYQENKNNFINSVAYHEMIKLEDSPFKAILLKALFAKYRVNAKTNESSETKRAKIE
jgi:hypothetical protein